MLTEEDAVKMREYKRNWYRANKEKSRESARKSYAANIEKQRERGREKYTANKDKYMDNQRKRLGRVDSGRRRGFVQSSESLYIKSIKSDSKKKHYLKKRYNITIDEWNKIIESQNGCCYICGRHFSSTFGGACVDHDHDTGKVRGALCRRCNAGLGNFSDKIELLRKAIAYLIRP